MLETIIDIALVAILAAICFAGVALSLLQLPGTWTIIVRIGTQEVARENVFVSGDGVTAGSTG